MKAKFILYLAGIFGIIQSSVAQDEGFMYGRITTIDNRTYEGPIRWGKEEVLWVDLFNAAKPVNENLRYLTRDDMRHLRDKRYEQNGSWGERWVSRWVSYDYGNDEEDFTHQFVCQFGELKSIRPSWRSSADVVMQNGQKFEVSGEGYNDVGGEIRIMDKELGEVALDWGRIELVEFMNTPSKLTNKFADVLYGVVETTMGKFVGFIAWDNDERLGTDKLDGRTSDGKLAIEFDKIASIEQSWDEARVELKSGRKITMCCSNDVDRSNRGVVVEDEKLGGKVEIPWREFKKVTFGRPENMKGYNAFKEQKELIGTVAIAGGKSLEGKIVYDLDEAFTYEVLQGKENDLEFIIPLRNISSIQPNGWSSATLELRNGTKLTLADSQDVSDKHTGVLVFSGSGEPSYVLWEDIREIKFK